MFIVFLLISGIVLGLIFPKSKLVSIALFLFGLVLAMYNTNNADLNNYVVTYTRIKKGLLIADDAKYLGYYLIQKLAISFGMEFRTYLSWYYSICFVLLYVALMRLTKNVNAVFAVFLLYPFALEVVQMKSFMSDVITLNAIVFLVKDEGKNKRNIIWFILLTLIASGLHFINMYFLIVGLIVLFRNVNTKSYWELAIIGLVLAYTGVLRKGVVFINNLIHIANGSLIDMWMNPRARFGVIVYATVIILMILNINYQEQFLNNDNQEEKKEYMVRLLSSAPLICCFLCYSVTFFRLYRVYWELYTAYMVDSVVLRSGRYISKGRVKALTLYLITMLIVFFAEVYPYYNSTLGSLLKYNSFF